MKIALIQQNYKVGDVTGNVHKIKEAIASVKDVEVAVIGADAVTGSPLFGLAGSERFRGEAAAALSDLETFAASSGVELVLKDTVFEGVAIHCAADHFLHGVAEANKGRIMAEAKVLGKPVVWVNQVGAQTDTIYYGGSCAAFPTGEVLTLPLFEEATVVIDTDSFAVSCAGSVQWGNRIEQLHAALVLGIRDYFAKSGAKDACVAMSGGIDSALVLALAVEALGPEHVKTIMLPSEYSTDHSVSDSEEMIRRVGIPKGQSWLVPIAQTFREALTALQPVLLSASGDACRGLAEENMQARIRLMMTMALSNSHNALMLNTSNKSEAAVGYGTLYGDTSGALGVIGDLYKEDVYALSRQINAAAVNEGRIAPIPEHILTKAPSAELRPGQKDSDSLPDYPVLDAILVRLVERGQSSAEVIAEGFDKATVERVCRLLLSGDFKRHQLPPALRVSGCTFGVEWRWPITASKTL